MVGNEVDRVRSRIRVERRMVAAARCLPARRAHRQLRDAYQKQCRDIADPANDCAGCDLWWSCQKSWWFDLAA